MQFGYPAFPALITCSKISLGLSLAAAQLSSSPQTKRKTGEETNEPLWQSGLQPRDLIFPPAVSCAASGLWSASKPSFKPSDLSVLSLRQQKSLFRPVLTLSAGLSVSMTTGCQQGADVALSAFTEVVHLSAVIDRCRWLIDRCDFRAGSFHAKSFLWVQFAKHPTTRYHAKKPLTQGFNPNLNNSF